MFQRDQPSSVNPQADTKHSGDGVLLMVGKYLKDNLFVVNPYVIVRTVDIFSVFLKAKYCILTSTWGKKVFVFFFPCFGGERKINIRCLKRTVCLCKPVEKSLAVMLMRELEKAAIKFMNLILKFFFCKEIFGSKSLCILKAVLNRDCYSAKPHLDFAVFPVTRPFILFH